MSTDLYLTCVRWMNGEGLVRTQLGERVLKDKPDLGIDYFEIEIVPGVIYNIRRHPAADWESPVSIELDRAAAYMSRERDKFSGKNPGNNLGTAGGESAALHR